MPVAVGVRQPPFAQVVGAGKSDEPATHDDRVGVMIAFQRSAASRFVCIGEEVRLERDRLHALGPCLISPSAISPNPEAPMTTETHEDSEKGSGSFTTPKKSP